MSKKFFAVFSFISCIVAATAAETQERIDNAWGDQDTNVFVGGISPWGTYVVMQRVSDGQCRFHYVGDLPDVVGGPGGLNNNYMFYSGNGDDQILLGQSAWICGYHVSLLRYNGHYFDVHAGGGDDRIACIGDQGDSWFYGDDGDDFIEAADYPGVHVYGGNGNDEIFGADPTNNEVLYGGAGNDAICDARYYDSEAYIIDGGTGTDCSPGDAAIMRNIESSNCGSRCVYIY